MAMTMAQLKKELHSKGIKTYYNKKTKASYIKKSDVKKILAVTWKKEITEQDFPDSLWDADEDLFKDLFKKSNGKLIFYREPNGSISVEIKGNKQLLMEPSYSDYAIFDQWMDE